MKKDPSVYLAQILERIERILQYTAGGKDAFIADLLDSKCRYRSKYRPD